MKISHPSCHILYLHFREKYLFLFTVEKKTEMLSLFLWQEDARQKKGEKTLLQLPNKLYYNFLSVWMAIKKRFSNIRDVISFNCPFTEIYPSSEHFSLRFFPLPSTPQAFAELGRTGTSLDFPPLNCQWWKRGSSSIGQGSGGWDRTYCTPQKVVRKRTPLKKYRF